MSDPEPDLTARHVLYALVGAGLLLVMGFFVFASGLVVPPWATVLLITVWIVAVVMAVRSWRLKMYAPVLWAVIVGVSWIVVVAVGDVVLGWNA